MILDALCRAVAARAAWGWGAAPLLLLWPYLRRLNQRFDRLAARVRAGRGAPAPARPAVPRAPTVRPPRLPGGRAWLLVVLGHEAACLGSQLRHLLDDPAMAALMRAAPQAGRMLRPLCRMLGVDLPAAAAATLPGAIAAVPALYGPTITPASPQSRTEQAAMAPILFAPA